MAETGAFAKVNLPSARNALPLLDEPAPTVSVHGGAIHCNGEVVGDARAIAVAGRLQRVDALWTALKHEGERWRTANPGKPLPGVIVFAFDRAEASVVVKSVFQTAAFAGYPYARFAVRGRDGAVMGLNVDAIVPGPPDGKAPKPAEGLLVVVRPSKQALVWRKSGAVTSATDDPSIGDLAERVQKSWGQHGSHLVAGDRTFDQAVLYVSDDVDYAGLIAVVDAIHATTRPYEVGGTTEQVPAINVNLSMAKEIGNDGNGNPLSSGEGRLPPEVIRRIVLQNIGHFKSCYAQGLARNKSLAGTVRVRFVIQASGSVADVVDAGESTLPDTDVVNCMMHEFGKLSFPPPEGGKVIVVYPLVFNVNGSPPAEEHPAGG